MKLSGHVVLVTGGGSGIGEAIAARFLAAGSEVVICGRRVDALASAKERHPGLHAIVADVATPEGREALFDQVTREFPRLNVIVNNAGVQQRLKLTEGVKTWQEHHEEIAINLEAPIHLAMLFVPFLRGQKDPVIVNVTSGLSFAPLPAVPIYSATKAALHSFTLSLRVQVAPLGIEVVEIVPPAVNTDLGGPGLHTFGVPLDAFADAVMARVGAGEQEVGYGTAEQSRLGSRADADAALERMAGM